MNIKKNIMKRLRQLLIVLDTPGALSARFRGCYFEMFQMLSGLKKIGVEPQTRLDVGANRGMFSRCANIVFPDAEIYAFEPLEDCYKELCNLNKLITGLKCYNYAIGDNNRDDIILRSTYDYSSSLLEMEKLHIEAFPYSNGRQIDNIQVRTLDNFYGTASLRSPILLKVDVQGYETKVIEGAKKILRDIDYIIIEMSFRKLYKGQGLFDDIYKSLVEIGFEYHGHIGQLNHPRTNELLQIDGLFLRKNVKHGGTS